jgi:hypothetical protein
MKSAWKPWQQAAILGSMAALAITATDRSGQTEPPPLPDKNDLVRFVDYPDRNEAELIVGPVHLPANGPHLRPPVQLAGLPIQGWLHGFSWEMRDAQGNPLPDRLLHHVNLIDPDNRELFSPIARRILAAGRETQEERIPRFLGYPLGADSRVLISSMFANPLEEDYHAYLHITLLYSHEGDGLVSPRDVYPFYIDVMGPVGEKEFPVPPGTTTMAWEGSPVIDGRLLAVGGHLHNYGSWIRFENVTEDNVLWESEPEVDDNGEVLSVPTGKMWWRGGLKLDKSHTYRLVVQYDNPTSMDAMDGGMGALGGIVYAQDAEWPEMNKNDPAYVEDLINTLEKPNQADHSHGGMEHQHDGGR